MTRVDWEVDFGVTGAWEVEGRGEGGLMGLGVAEVEGRGAVELESLALRDDLLLGPGV